MWIRLHSLFLMLLLVGCANAPPASDEPMDLAIAGEFDGYAQLLQGQGQGEDASRVAGYAETMRQSDAARRRAEQAYREGRPFDTSFYMGFDPYQVLIAYAADLRAVGRGTDAERVGSLAVRWRAQQLRAAEALING